MQKFLGVALATIMVAVPLASSQARDFRRPHANGAGAHHGAAQYPRGWGPHRGPDRVGYYHGYQGYRDRRPGYRRHSDGMWYPAAAFTLGAFLAAPLVADGLNMPLVKV